MTTITLSPAIAQKLEMDARQKNMTVSELVNEALERYVLYSQREKLRLEAAAYRDLHDQLKRDHLGQWVAIHEQRLVDSDPDGPTLYRRVRSKYGRTSVLVRQVEEEIRDEIRLRTRSTGKI